MEKAIITTMGEDKVGIVYNVSKILYENNVNIIDISQKVFTDNIFSMIMLVQLNDNIDIATLREKFTKLDILNVKVFIQGTELFKSMYEL
ncbi:ACT domain-containing protein [Oceanivirga miroungae]|uniref:ACT domain-containing protein n=1 Tax=Oceanivirga miroungae TaxID=1130046 RepID=A0A6I8M8R5_9FUSO|nr:ACT domain-containing protein [Oceanivirga miroungae]VWL85885.1 ACT domain-containing protein [Oceanivirga miroungae]